jgi:hypothetical protein
MTTTLVCFLDSCHRVFQDGYLSPDPRFNKVTGPSNMKLEIDKLSEEERNCSVLKNVSTEEVDPSWVKQMLSTIGLSWAAEIVPEDWPRVITATFDVDFSGVDSKQLFAKIINAQHKSLNIIHDYV